MSAEYEELKAAAEAVTEAEQNYLTRSPFASDSTKGQVMNDTYRRFLRAAPPDLIAQLVTDLSAAQTALAEAEARGKVKGLEEVVEVCQKAESDFNFRQAHAEAIGEGGMAKRYIYRAEGVRSVREGLKAALGG